ncbi:MAG TPA: HNH endonuclease [Vicinamibacterales bacterium]|nr:HNH endonuclease [Vicinamibacterales bacterium]
MQLPRQVAAALLMPHPVRAEVALGSGQPILRADRYAIENIEVTRAILQDENRAQLAVGDMTLRNVSLHGETLRTVERLSNIVTLWQRAEELPGEIAHLIQKHELEVRSGAPIDRATEQTVVSLQDVVAAEAQALGVLYGHGGDDVITPLLDALSAAPAPPSIKVDEVPPEETEIRRRTVRQWKRWVASRGAQSARFSSQVREAYGWTCVVCGLHLPSTSYNQIAGVDGAHILPWADYDLDVVSNGLCLCKQHHWAFDEALLVIGWNGTQYHVSIPGDAESRVLGETPRFSLENLRQFVGAVAMERLPRDRVNWPDPSYLAKLYESEL